MNNRRIFYVSDNTKTPTGGVLVAHQHVRTLVANGFDAKLLLRRVEGPDFFGADVPAVRLAPDFAVRRGDIYVIPEPWNDMLEAFARFDVRKMVFCQNHHYVYYGLGAKASYADYGVDTVFCCSNVIADYLRSVLGLERVPVVPNWIDTDLFRPLRKRSGVAYMPRKMKVEGNFIRGTFRRRHPRYAEHPWWRLEMMTRTQVAEALGRTAVFLALGRNEGLGLPPLEAMAAGNLVVGFTADGGRDFATEENGFWCNSDDLVGCADRVAEALDLFESRSEDYHRMVAAGQRTASRYDLASMERALLAFWQEEICR